LGILQEIVRGSRVRQGARPQIWCSLHLGSTPHCLGHFCSTKM
jgi:hypothetical protein